MLSGHEHDYERSYPVRGYDAGDARHRRRAQPGQTKGAAVDTRRPSVVTTEPYELQRHPGVEHRRGHGVPGARRRRHQRADQHLRHGHRRRQAAGQGHHRRGTPITGSRGDRASPKNGADSIEDAPWSAAINPTDAYGYSIFDVDPGERPRRDDHHLPVLRDPGGEQRGGHRPRRHHHAAERCRRRSSSSAGRSAAGSGNGAGGSNPGPFKILSLHERTGGVALLEWVLPLKCTSSDRCSTAFLLRSQRKYANIRLCPNSNWQRGSARSPSARR